MENETKIATAGQNANARDDEKYMRRCIQLALNAEGRTYPNPMVGAVVVCDGRIIGEGWHHKAGQPHAEVNAIASVRDPRQLSRSTIYVSLEPCAHQGRTPPCADLIISKRIPRVVVGCRDTFARVDGRGIMKLREAGVDVTVGVLEDECRWLNRRFFTIQEKGRPYVILKWARTADGFIGDVVDGAPSPLAVSGAEALTLEHRRRTTEDGILVGAGTVRSDNPRLTPRLWEGPSPARLILAPSLRLPPQALALTDGGRTVVVNRTVEAEAGVVKYVARPLSEGGVARDALDVASAEGLNSIIVEGGAQTLRSFIAEGLWDEAYVYESDAALGHAGVASPELCPSTLLDATRAGLCTLRHYANPASVALPHRHQ